MSRPARIIAALVVLATVGAVLAAFFVYRNSTDGQGGAFWGLLILYGLVGLGVVWVVDAGVRRFRR